MVCAYNNSRLSDNQKNASFKNISIKIFKNKSSKWNAGVNVNWRIDIFMIVLKNYYSPHLLIESSKGGVLLIFS